MIPANYQKNWNAYTSNHFFEDARTQSESLPEKVTYANGANQSLTYDPAGKVTAETDAEGYTKQYLYDKVNRLTGVIDQLGNKTNYKYDALDNIAKVTDAMLRTPPRMRSQTGEIEHGFR